MGRATSAMAAVKKRIDGGEMSQNWRSASDGVGRLLFCDGGYCAQANFKVPRKVYLLLKISSRISTIKISLYLLLINKYNSYSSIKHG